MTRIGIAQVNITPNAPVWLVGYGDRDHKSEGVYQALRAGAVSIATPTEELVIITADLIGYDLAYAAAAKAHIGQKGRLVGQEAVQMHGGMGMTDELAIGHYFKRLTMIDTLFGNSDFHLERFASITHN